MVAVAPAGREEQYGSYVGVDEGYHRRGTIAAVAAVYAACHRLETGVIAAVVDAVCHHPGPRDQRCCCFGCRGMPPPRKIIPSSI